MNRKGGRPTENQYFETRVIPRVLRDPVRCNAKKRKTKSSKRKSLFSVDNYRGEVFRWSYRHLGYILPFSREQCAFVGILLSRYTVFLPNRPVFWLILLTKTSTNLPNCSTSFLITICLLRITNIGIRVSFMLQ